MAKRAPVSMPVGMVMIRVVVGAILLVNGWRWVTEGGFDGAVVRDAVESVGRSQSGFLAWWSDAALSKNPDAFAFLWRWGALVFGVSLVLGAFVRPTGAFAILFLAHGIAYGSEELELLFLLLAVTIFACAVSGAGRRAGLDALFDQHFPSWLTWTKRPSSSFLG